MLILNKQSRSGIFLSTNTLKTNIFITNICPISKKWLNQIIKSTLSCSQIALNQSDYMLFEHFLQARAKTNCWFFGVSERKILRFPDLQDRRSIIIFNIFPATSSLSNSCPIEEKKSIFFEKRIILFFRLLLIKHTHSSIWLRLVIQT